MKKYLIALAVALMVCLLGMTASAQTADEATTDASEIIADALREPMKNGVLSSAEAEQIAKEALVSAGLLWRTYQLNLLKTISTRRFWNWPIWTLTKLTQS